MLAELTRYSLIRLETENRYSIHRLVQEVLRDALTPKERQQWLDRAVNALNATFPNPEFQNWWRCARLVEQVQTIAAQKATETPELARLFNQTAYFLHNQGRYGEAEMLYLQAIAILYQQLGETHPNTQAGLGNFVNLLQQVVAAGRSAELSDHPVTQALLAQLQTESSPD